MAQFGELLAELRQERKMTQHELADILFVTPGTISNYEKGVHFPDLEKLMDLADYFDVTTDYLLGRCSANLSPDVFEQQVVDGKTLGEFIQDLRHLTPERRDALTMVLRDMKFSMLVGQYSKRENV